MFVKICWHRSLKHVTKGSAQNPNYIECRGTYHAQSSFNYSYSRLYKFLVATHITNGQKFQTISTIALFMFFTDTKDKLIFVFFARLCHKKFHSQHQH